MLWFVYKVCLLGTKELPRLAKWCATRPKSTGQALRLPVAFCWLLEQARHSTQDCVEAKLKNLPLVKK